VFTTFRKLSTRLSTSNTYFLCSPTKYQLNATNIFMDGQLTKSIYMDNVLVLTTGNEGLLRRGWYGALANFRIFNYALTDDEILYDYSKRADKSLTNPMDSYGRFRKK